MGLIEHWLCLDCLNAFETPEEGAGHWADDEGQAICDGPLTKVVPANQLAGAVSAEEVERLANAIKRDRREPDKVLCHVQTLNGLALRSRFGGQ